MPKEKPLKLPVPVSGFYTMARSNLEGAKRIASTLATEEERNGDSCIQFLLGWAAEGYLKTFLAAHDVPEGDLRNLIGHDLNEAFRKAGEQGLEIAGLGQLKFVIGKLAPNHLNMFWRYLPTNADGTERCYEMVMPCLAFPSLDELDCTVWLLVQEDLNLLLKKQGKPPMEKWHAAAILRSW